MVVYSVIYIIYMIYMKEYYYYVFVGLYMLYVCWSKIYLIKMNIYNFVCEIIVYIYREF